MKLNVTRKQVLQAIRTEPLRGNRWFHIKMDDITGKIVPSRKADKNLTNNSKCAVCAVGGILDCALGGEQQASALSDFAGSIVSSATVEDFIGSFDGVAHGVKLKKTRDPEKLFKIATLASLQGKHLSGLSMLFEGLYSQKRFRTPKTKLANKRLRDILIKFVKKNFPKRLIATEDKTI